MIKNSDGSEFAESRIAGMDVQIDLLALLQRQANTCSCRLGEANCFAHHCECRGCWTESRGRRRSFAAVELREWPHRPPYTLSALFIQ